MLLLFIGRRYLYYMYEVWNVDFRRPLSTPAINISATFILPGHWKHCTKSSVWEKEKKNVEKMKRTTKNQRTKYKWKRYGVKIWKRFDFREEEPFRKPFNRVSTWIKSNRIANDTIFFSLHSIICCQSLFDDKLYIWTHSQIYFHYMMF